VKCSSIGENICVKEEQKTITVNEIAKDLIEQIAIEARKSEYVDAKSGVSARLTISAYENLVAAAERRSLIHEEKNTNIRVSDFIGVVPAITGKVELVYEGEQEGPLIVAQNLIGKAIRTQFSNYFPDPDKFRKQKEKSPYKTITDWFGDGNVLDVHYNQPTNELQKILKNVPGLSELVDAYHKKEDTATKLFLMEFALHGMAEFSLLSKGLLTQGHQFKDILGGMFAPPSSTDFDEDEEDDDDASDSRRKR